jgi:branched-chain amino acid aminotransferase
MAPNTLPAMAKSTANYANSQLIKMEASLEGYAEGIALDTEGNISEASGQNVFVVRDGIIYTPPISSSVLGGVTRNSVITLARDLDIEVREQVLPREMLYVAEEVFFTGTAAEITPVRSVDRIEVGRGLRGSVTKALQERFFQIVRGEAANTRGWLQYVDAPEQVAAASGDTTSL